MPFFAAFMIFFFSFCEMKGTERRRLIPSVYMGARWNWLSPCPVTVHPFLEMKWIHYYLKAPYPEKKRMKKKEKCVHEISTERNACLPKEFPLSSIKDLGTSPSSCVWLSLSPSGRLEHLQIWRRFFFSCFVMRVAVPWIPTCGPPLPLHARNVALKSEIGMKHKSSLP